MNEEERVQEQVQIPEETSHPTPAEPPILRTTGGKFAKGRSANPTGKPKGSVTKKTERLKMMMQLGVADRFERYLQELDGLEGREFVTEFRALMEFCIPRLQRIDATNLNVEVKETQIIEIGGKIIKIN